MVGIRETHRPFGESRRAHGSRQSQPELIRFRGVRRASTALVAAATALMLAAGCGSDDSGGGSGRTTTSGRTPTIAFLAPNTNTRWIVADAPAFKRSVREICAGCKVLTYNADGAAAAQQRQFETAIAQGAKVIVVSAFDTGSLSALVARANSQRIAVISYEEAIQNAPISYEIGFNSLTVGKQLARSLVDRMKELGTSDKCVVAIQGDATDHNGKLFWQGSEPIFKAAGADICFNKHSQSWDPANAQRNMDAAITQIGAENIGGVYVHNDDMAGAAITALKRAGVKKLPPFTGQDGTTAGVQRIIAGDQYMTVWRDSFTLADRAAKIAYAFATGEKPKGDTTVNNGALDVPATILDPVVVTRDNVKETVVASGFTKPSELCAGRYASACADLGIS